MRELLFISCTPGAKEDTRLYASLQKLGLTNFRFLEHNRRGLSAGYNTFLRQFANTNRILVFVHDDVTLADVFIQEKLDAASQMFDIVGLVGSSRFDLHINPPYNWSAWPASSLSGAVEHLTAQGLAFWSYFGPTPQRCVILDGLFLAVDMLTIRNVRFDEQFTFHLYDLDFSLAAHHAGLVCGTTNIYAQHASQGDYASPDYLQAAQLFQQKWSAIEATDARPLSIDVDPAPPPGCHAVAGCHASTAQFAGEACSKTLPSSLHPLPANDRAAQLHQLLAAAIADLRRQIESHPTDPILHFRLGKALQESRAVDDAIASYQSALALEPRYVAALNNLGLAHNDTGNVPAAIACFRQAVALAPDVPAAHSNLIYTLHYLPDITAEEIYREHRAWAQKFADPLAPAIRPPTPPRDPAQRLRIGYVSPNFRQHPVGRMLAGLFAAHDHHAFEIICYNTGTTSDPLTTRLRAGADEWHDIASLSDEALAAQIRADHIDILVDLTMHMANNRLLTFARQPAPIQVTYLAYCSTTGLSTIDYRLTDPHLDPEEEETQRVACPVGQGPRWACSRAHYSEKSLSIPSYWCYAPPPDAPEVNPLPALTTGHITFASLNNFAKVSPAALALFARILAAVPNSHLLLHACPGNHRNRVLTTFAAAGIAPERLAFFDHLPHPQYLALHHAIDIALDAFPYSGGTTTADALYMGVPTISLYAAPAFTRGGLSILTAATLPDLAVSTEEAYFQKALTLATDLPALSTVRATLRPRLQASPLLDSRAFARSLESAYRQMWHALPIQRPPA